MPVHLRASPCTIYRVRSADKKRSARHNTPPHLRRAFSAALAVTLVFAHVRIADAADAFQWIEAERPILENFPANPFAPHTDAEHAALSGGGWIGAYGKRPAPLFAVYNVDLPADGHYRLFARKFWKHGPWRVKFNDGPWLDVSADCALLDEVELRENVVVNWTPACALDLKAGHNRFRIESTSNDGAIAFDCFLLTTGDFTARGLTRPGVRLTSSEAGWFAWDPPADLPGSPIDLRYLNEPFAGSDGWIIARGSQFVHERTGTPVRFWGVNCGPDVARLDDCDLERLATLLSSRGANLIRWHGAIYTTDGKNVGTIDARQIANLQRAIAIFKRHGVYATLSIYFPNWLTLDESAGWSGYHKQTPYALLFFDTKFQAMYRSWWRALLTTPGADGVMLKDEPAVLSLELLNEDSTFFWTFQPRKTLPIPLSETIETRFGTWLLARYGGTLNDIIARWDIKLDADAPPAGRVGVLDAGRLAGERGARAKDTTRFLFGVQREFYADTRRFLLEELGSRSLVSAGNWTTASDQFLGPVERASNLAGDFIDRHAYYNGQHDGPRAGYHLSAGDSFADRSALRFDPDKPGGASNPWNAAFDVTYNDRPTMASEIDWLEPNRFRGEAPLVTAALGAMEGTDALEFFAVNGQSWQPTVSKFAALTPVELGQWPAAALIYRLGFLDEAPTLADAHLKLDEVLDLAGGVRGTDARARWIGASSLTIGDSPTSRPSVDLSSFVDADAKTLRSATGQLALDYGHGVLAIDAPCVKGIVGFLATRNDATALGCLAIHSPMDFGAIAVVSLDGKPIASSARLLVQAMSEERNAGFKTSGAPLRKIDSIGVAPIVVRDLAGTIGFTDGSEWTAQPLDQNGQPLGQPLTTSSEVKLAPTIVYYALTRKQH